MARLLQASDRVLSGSMPLVAHGVARDPEDGWETVYRLPAPQARASVLGRYLGWVERRTAQVRRREVPFGGIPLILNFGPAFTIEPASGTAQRLTSFVAGMYDEHVIVASTGASCCMQVNLTALGASRVLGVAMHTLTNRTVPLDDVLGAEGRLLVARLGEAPSWAARFAVLDAFFTDRLDAAPATPSPIAWAVGHLHATAGQASVAELLGTTGASAKRLIADFREHVGLTPKLLGRVLRFERAVMRMRQDAPRLRWSELALECGYYDQAHLIREFRALAGCTPTELLGSVLPDGGLGVTR
jgi:AraC-like DNA-binding protein